MVILKKKKKKNQANNRNNPKQTPSADLDLMFLLSITSHSKKPVKALNVFSARRPHSLLASGPAKLFLSNFSDPSTHSAHSAQCGGPPAS